MKLIKTDLPGNIVKIKPDINRIDASIASQFKGELAEIISNGNNNIILDFNDVSFIDSSGLGAIVATYKKVKPVGKLVILTTSQAVLTMLKLTRLERVLTIIKSNNIMDAIEKFD